MIVKWSSTGNTGRKKSLDTINDSINQKSSFIKNMQNQSGKKSQ